ncbi:MAG: hypothetical protein WAS36_02185 [Candidatus Saccharimonadales bacterium]
MNPEKIPGFGDERGITDRSMWSPSDYFSEDYGGAGVIEPNMRNFLVRVPNCNMEDGVFNDTVWDNSEPRQLSLGAINEPALTGLFYSDPIRRLQAVEQLTLPPYYATVPGTGAFSRFEHLWGSVLFVEQLSRKHGISGREKLILQLRTLVSDMAHTTGSHLGDWLFQGVGGKEDQHDLELKQYLGATGVLDLLENNKIDPDEVIFPDKNDWVEADQPDLCVDRVDYGLREMNRWNAVVSMQAFRAEDFEITPDNMLAMTEVNRARIFAEGFLLLSQENWSNPVHRAVLDLFMLRTKIFYARGAAPDMWLFDHDQNKTRLIHLNEIHPRDLMYVTDPGQMQAFARPDLAGHTIEALMTSISRYNRQYVWPAKNERVMSYMQQFTKEAFDGTSYIPFNDAMHGSYLDGYPPTLPSGFAILEGEVEPDEQSINLVQKPFKLRQIDPLVKNGDAYSRLSELQPSYAERLAEHALAQSKTYTARISIPDPRTRSMLKETIESVDEFWDQRLQSGKRLTPVQLRELVRASARDIHGAYPFMSFLSY